MPATERSFAQSVLPLRVYLDSDFLLNLLQPSDPHHGRSLIVAERLIQQERTQIYISTFTWVEIIHVATRPEFRDRFPEEFRANLRLDQWQDAAIRDSYIQMVLARTEDLLAPFEWYEVIVTPEVFRDAMQYLALYNLGCQDAVHLACMRYAGIADLISFDRGFRRIDGLFLWNDRIFDSH